METRSRKRAEGKSQRPPAGVTSAATDKSSSDGKKRARIEPPPSAPAAPAATTTRRLTRSSARMEPPAGASARQREEIDKKGKREATVDRVREQELERERERERDRREIPSDYYDEEDSGEDDYADDGDDEDLGVRSHHYPPAAFEGRLREFAGYYDVLPPSASQNGRMKEILARLRDDGDYFSQTEALTELCNILSMATENSLAGFSIESFVPLLVGLLNREGFPDVMLLAARALTHLCDALPSSCSAVVHHGAIPAFCARLLTIEYMDLAEQSLQALEKISHRHASACLRGGALMAVLSYLDFFSTGVKRVALSTAANICKQLSSDTIASAMETIPTLTGLLSDNDTKVVENASFCLARIAEACASSPENLNKLSSYSLVSQAANLISVTNSGSARASLSSSTYTVLIRLLSTCASSSALSTKELLEMGISGILRDILASSGLVSQIAVPFSSNRPPDQLYEIVSLVNKLLPSLPHKTISLPATHSIGATRSTRKQIPRNSRENVVGTSKTVADISDHEKLLRDKPELLVQFGADLFPVLVQVHGSSVNSLVRHKCLEGISKVLYFGTEDMLKSLLQGTNIPSFLAGVLTGKDVEVLIPALQMAEVLMQKLPLTISKLFMKEGVVHAVEMLISSDSCLAVKESATMPPTLRRNKRLPGGSTNEAIRIEGSKDSVSGKGGSRPSVGTSAIANVKLDVSAYARHFKDAYFSADSGVDAGATDSLFKLKGLCIKLNGYLTDPKSKSKGKGKRTEFVAVNNDQLSNIVADILREISEGDGVSTFEFVRSGVVESLLNYFSGGALSKENLLKHHKQVLKRLQLFVELSLPVNYEGKETPLTTLVRKLHDALASLEHFELVLNHIPNSQSANTSISSVLNALSKPLKLRLCRAQGEKSLRDHSSVLFMNPLASFADLEDLLWSKVQTNETETRCHSGEVQPGSTSVSTPSQTIPAQAAESRPSTRSKSLTVLGSTTNAMDSAHLKASKEKGKSISRNVIDDFRGPETRSAARRKATMDSYSQMKQQNGESSDEDEDHDFTPVEIGEAIPMEEDYSSEEDGEEDDEEDEIYLAERVHEAELGYPSYSSAFASRTATTAAMTGHASTSAKGAIRSRDHRTVPNRRNANVCPRLNFFIGGKQLDRSSTLYQAIMHHTVLDGYEQRYAGSDYSGYDSRRFWDEVYTITYQSTDATAKRDLTGTSKTYSTPKNTEHMSLLDSILQRKLPCDLDKSNSTYKILLLLRIIEGLNRLAPSLRAQASSDAFAEGKLTNLDELKVNGPVVPQEEFLSNKLTPKLTRQMQDALALCSGSMPPWCQELTKACPFLFPFETRRQYFYSTALGLSRALQYFQQQQSAENPNLVNYRGRNVVRLERQKVRVSRRRILDSAVKVMEMFCSGQKAVLEVEYFGEVGTGLGPTLEFYTLVSQELQRSTLGMWRTNSSPKEVVESDVLMPDAEEGHLSLSATKNNTHRGHTEESGRFVQAPLGLFPRPFPSNTDCSNGSGFSKVRDNFCLLGRLMAKALQDGRLLDLPLSTAFYKLVLGQELDLHDIRSFDAQLGSTLQEMEALVHRKNFLESIPSDTKEAISNLSYRGARVEDLCIDFTLPGFPDYPLKPDGNNILVNIDNVEEYVSLVVDATIKTGIMSQIEAFRTGFNQVLPLSSLQIFTENELDYLFCGVRNLWVAETLTDYVKFDHGYTAQSPPILNLLEIMAEFTPSQQQAFLQFITGCPRLPPGGLGALNPKLTVVRKNFSGAIGDPNSQRTMDAELPSVMTCANYLKLPPYSSKEVMRDRLLYAITEGQGSFDLS